MILLWCLVACGGGPRILSRFGSRVAILSNPDRSARARDRPHDGVDIGLYEIGDPVIASADGTVATIQESAEVGVEVFVDHEPASLRMQTGYSHLVRSRVTEGQRVRRGDRIGDVGLFPASGGVIHVHWTLWQRDWHGVAIAIDPLPWTHGCYSPTSDPSSDAHELRLTYPVECR